MAKGAVGAEHHLAQVVVVADAGHDEVLARCGFLRRPGAPAAMLRDPFLGLGGGTVVDGDIVAALGLEMAGHRITHHAETEKRDLRHPVLLEAGVSAREQSGRTCGPHHDGPSLATGAVCSSTGMFRRKPPPPLM